MKKIWLVPLFLSVLLIAPIAEGGVLSPLATILGSLTKKNELSPNLERNNNDRLEVNSQNLKLPEPVIGNLSASSSRLETEMTIIGGSAILSETGPLGTLADIKDERMSPDLISVYTVRPGDTISVIAQMHNVSVNTIRWANDLKRGDVIKPGDTLVILPITGIKLTVKKGDTINSLAKKYGGDFEEIVAYNDLDPTKGLAVGQTIIIPNGEESVVVSSVKPQTTPPRYQAPSYSGYFMSPLVSYRRTQGLHGHNAVDMAAPPGTPIYAAASGQVIIARASGWNGGYGNYIVISHPNGTQTLYSHLSILTVSSGQKVNKGDKIGEVGNTGRSTGYHLHFEIRGAVNPF